MVHDSDVFAISASLLEPRTGISDTQLSAYQAPHPASIFATAAAVAASAPSAATSNGGGKSSAPQASQPQEEQSLNNNQLKNGARWPLLAGRDVSSVQQDAAESSGDGLRPGKRRKGVNGASQPAPTAWEAPGVSLAAAEISGYAQYVSKKELRLIRQAAAAAALLTAAADVKAAAAAADVRIDTRSREEAAVQVHSSWCNGSALEGAESVPKKKKRKHTSSDGKPVPVEESMFLQAAPDGTSPADETAGDMSRMRKKHKYQNLKAATASSGGTPELEAVSNRNGPSMHMDNGAIVQQPKKKKKRKDKAHRGEEQANIS